MQVSEVSRVLSVIGVVRLWWCAAAALIVTCPGAALAQVDGHGGFTDVTEEAGLTHVQRRERVEISGSTADVSTAQFITGGAAVGDFFGDGLLDLYVTRHDDTDILYRNMGDGTFEDVTTQVFGDQMTNAKTNGAMFADLDNDGTLDLYVTSNGGNRHFLYMNDGNGKLTEQAIARGVDHSAPDGGHRNGMSSTVGDYDNDGYLDLYVADWRPRGNDDPARNRLFRNQGGDNVAHFEDVTVAAGLDGSGNQWGYSARFADMDRDGDMDLLTVNDFFQGQYYDSDGDGTFTERSSRYGTGTAFSEMGSTIADYNNDGYLDWFVTGIHDKDGNRLYRNELHRNLPNTFYSNQTDAGVKFGYWGWGTSFVDFDNDGDRDLVMTNGWNGPLYDNQPMRFFRNDGETGTFTFTEISDELGLTDRGQGRGLLVGDFSGNGFQDILVINHAGEPVLYRNEGNDNSYLRINTVGEITNRMGLGAFITVVPDMNEGSSLVHEVNLGSNFLSHNETTAHFGLGAFEGLIDYIHILWPSGEEQEFYDIEPNQLLTVNELTGIQTTAVPEPTSLALLLAGGVAALRRGRRRVASRC